jgi:hypothetical protein
MRNSFRVLILGVALIATRSFVQAADAVQLTSLPVTVAWDKSPGEDVKGYRLYYGLSAGGDYFESVDVGNVTTYTFPDLAPGKTYYCVIRAYNAAGKESLPSNEISFSVPKSPARAKPASTNLRP